MVAAAVAVARSRLLETARSKGNAQSKRNVGLAAATATAGRGLRVLKSGATGAI